MIRQSTSESRPNRLANREASPFSKQSLAYALRTIAPMIVALTFASAAHAQGTMDFTGAQTLMGTFKSSPEILHILSDLIATAQERFGGIDLFERPEYRLLGIYGLPSLDDRFGGDALAQSALFDGVLALRELERRYLVRIRHMERDTYHWSQINSTGDLVDWALLIAEVAGLRNGFKPFFPDNIKLVPEIRFCWDLATALA